MWDAWQVAPAPKVEAPAASEGRRDRPLPPWAAEIEALYEKVGHLSTLNLSNWLQKPLSTLVSQVVRCYRSDG